MRSPVTRQATAAGRAGTRARRRRGGCARCRSRIAATLETRSRSTGTGAGSGSAKFSTVRTSIHTAKRVFRVPTTVSRGHSLARSAHYLSKPEITGFHIAAVPAPAVRRDGRRGGVQLHDSADDMGRAEQEPLAEVAAHARGAPWRCSSVSTPSATAVIDRPGPAARWRGRTPCPCHGAAMPSTNERSIFRLSTGKRPQVATATSSRCRSRRWRAGRPGRGAASSMRRARRRGR